MYGGVQNQWKAGTEKATWFRFGIPFLCFLVASPFYAWGIRELLDKYEHTSATRDSFSWGDEIVMLVGIFLGLAAYNDINKEVRKLNKIRLVVAACDALLDSVSFTIRNDKQTVKLRTWSGSTVDYQLSAAVAETVTMIVMCPIILLWESVVSSGDVLAQASDLSRNFSDVSRVGIGQYSVVPDLLLKDFNSGFRPLGIIMTSLIESRITQLATLKVVEIAKLQPPVTHLRNITSEFVRIRERSTWWWISVGNTIIGVLYIILSPFLLWFGQGMYMIITYPIIFLVVGGLITYRWYLGDVLRRPTDMHLLFVYNDIATLATRADTLLSDTTTGRYMNLIVNYNIAKSNGYKIQ